MMVNNLKELEKWLNKGESLRSYARLKGFNESWFCQWVKRKLIIEKNIDVKIRFKKG